MSDFDERGRRIPDYGDIAEAHSAFVQETSCVELIAAARREALEEVRKAIKSTAENADAYEHGPDFYLGLASAEAEVRALLDQPAPVAPIPADELIADAERLSVMSATRPAPAAPDPALIARYRAEHNAYAPRPEPAPDYRALCEELANQLIVLLTWLETIERSGPQYNDSVILEVCANARDALRAAEEAGVKS